MTRAVTSTLPVVFIDGGYRIQFGNGLAVPLRNHGDLVQTFDPGWFPRFVYVGFYPIMALELQHRDGRQATWWLDGTMNGVGDSVRHLGKPIRELLLRNSAHVMRHIVDASFSATHEPVPDSVNGFYSLNPNTRQEIIDSFLRQSIPPIGIRDITQEDGVILIATDHGEVEVFDRDRVKASLEMDFRETSLKWLGGAMSWKSIYDDGEFEFRGSMPLDDFRFALKFSDAEDRREFFLLVSHHCSQVIGIFSPSCSSVFCLNGERIGLFRSLYSNFEDMLGRHLKKYSSELKTYFASGKKKIASLPRLAPQTHLGHQLWNELSGVDMVLRNRRPGDLPEWWIVEADESVEIYGPLERLYPEIATRVRRGLSSLDEATRFAYKNNFALLRITDEYVSSGLRARIKSVVDATAIGQEVNRYVSENRRGPIVVFGLRTENRTHVDPVDFFVRVAKSFERRFGKGTIVIDGHNGNEEFATTGKVRSHGEHLSLRPPVDVEREIVDAVGAGLKGTGVDVVSTIGASMYRSAAWGNNADCFIGIWGAGLTKYRWISNIPGAIVSSAHNLGGRPDFNIYFNEKYMEDPSPVLMPPRGTIEDDAQAKLLISVADQSSASYYNFRDRPELLEDFLSKLWDSMAGWKDSSPSH
ncbi:hypothetical protein [Neorhizobium alkalisoli]|uniref:Uncharacterized protein n=1 Tax=Neorhizobium alkalisoli TaxID=528178 RepID=A0A561R3G1_9HYPH|nr:hypothetical protein [Neorhizobium alkalisoli]TWF57160.1 hypothetical protein FHW37_102801 [Neorhizobium alkalisoli]